MLSSRMEELLKEEVIKKVKEEVERMNKLSMDLASKAPLILSVETIKKIMEELNNEES